MVSRTSPSLRSVSVLNPASVRDFAARTSRSFAGFAKSCNSGAYPAAICGGAATEIGCRTCSIRTSAFSRRNCCAIFSVACCDDFDSSTASRILIASYPSSCGWRWKTQDPENHHGVVNSSDCKRNQESAPPFVQSAELAPPPVRARNDQDHREHISCRRQEVRREEGAAWMERVQCLPPDRRCAVPGGGQ